MIALISYGGVFDPDTWVPLSGTTLPPPAPDSLTTLMAHSINDVLRADGAFYGAWPVAPPLYPGDSGLRWEGISADGVWAVSGELLWTGSNIWQGYADATRISNSDSWQRPLSIAMFVYPIEGMTRNVLNWEGYDDAEGIYPLAQSGEPPLPFIRTQGTNFVQGTYAGGLRGRYSRLNILIAPDRDYGERRLMPE